MNLRGLSNVIGIVILVALVAGVFLLYNLGQGGVSPNIDSIDISEASFLDIQLKDIRTQETFTIGQFVGEKPILLESFAVWCPTCTQQQNKVKQLHDELGDSFISISLDTDPNEDEDRIVEHLDRNGFDWRYAISPIDLTQSLIDDFGIGFVNAPSAPVILICEDGNARKLENGLKSVDVLKQEINRGC